MHALIRGCRIGKESERTSAGKESERRKWNNNIALFKSTNTDKPH